SRVWRQLGSPRRLEGEVRPSEPVPTQSEHPAGHCRSERLTTAVIAFPAKFTKATKGFFVAFISDDSSTMRDRDIQGNPLRARLESGQLAVGLGVRLARSIEIAPLAARWGFDWLFLDLEHSAMSLQVAADISVAAIGAGVTPLARVSARD